MDMMKNKKVAYCVDFVTVHHCTKFSSHICNIGDFTEGGHIVPPPRYYKGPKSPVLIGLRSMPGSRMPDAKCRMANAGCRMPDAGCQTPGITKGSIE